MYGAICVTENDIITILKRYECINSYKIDISYFTIFITVNVNESHFLMELLRGLDLRQQLEELKNLVPISIELSYIINYE